MNKLRVLMCCLVLTVLFACNANSYDKGGNQYNGNADIKGIITNMDSGSVVLYKLTSQQIISMDSSSIDDKGRFSFSKPVEESGFYRIGISDDKYVNLILNTNDKIDFTGNALDLGRDYFVEGSKESNRLKDFNTELAKVFVKNDSLNNLGKAYQQSNNLKGLVEVQQEMQALNIEYGNFVREFIRDNPNSLATLAAVQKLNPEQDVKYFLMVEENLKKDYGNSEIYQSFAAQVKGLKQLAPGSEAPEILLNDTSGSPLALSDLRGKVVLIDFWASWCRPCRAENPNVVRMYNKYKDKGFDIYSVSLDNNRSRWINAIEQDGLAWNHVSDLKGWQSVVVPMYKVQGIPMTFLVDEEGKIIAKNLRGASLEAKLEELFGG